MIKKKVLSQVDGHTPDIVVDIIVGQMQIAQEARLRVKGEGIVVRNIGGLVIQHPAIKIRNDAEKITATLIDKYS